MESSAGPLAGIRVIDLSRWIAGPYCTGLLADLGADVIRVERPSGEESRHLPPMLADDSAYCSHYGKGKRAIALDTRSPEDVAVLCRLIASADMVVENYRPGTMDAMGLGPEQLERLNPRLIAIHVSGYGQHGPWSRRPLFNAIAEATSGFQSLSRSTPAPTVSGNFAIDHTAGLLAVAGALAALYERTSSGRGQHVDVSLFDAAFSVLGFGLTAALNGVEVETVPGNRDAMAAPGNVFPTADGRHIAIDAGTDALYRALAEALGMDPDDPRFLRVEGRNAEVDELERLIGERTQRLTAERLAELLERAGVPHGIVATVAEAIEHPVVAERGLVVTFEGDGAEGDGTRAPVRVPGVPIAFDRTPGRVRRRPPAVGEHTDEVVAELTEWEARDG